MQALRGKHFLQLTGTTLVLVSTALWQNQAAPRSAKTPESVLAQCATYQRYEEALQLLDENHPVSAVELLTSFPDEKLGIADALLKESQATSAPGTLFLRLGVVLANRASEAAQGGATHQAQLLRDACATLQGRLERGGYHGESSLERTQRLQVAELLRRCTQRAEAAILRYQSS